MKKVFSNDYRRINESSYLLEVYDVIQKDKGELVPYHWHYEPEVMYCYKGRVDINCNGEIFNLNQDDILFINSSQIHSVYIHPNSETLTFVFDLDSLISRRMDECDQKFLLPLKNLDTVIVSNIISEKDYVEKYRELKKIIKDIIDLNTTRPFGFQLELKAFLYRFLYTLVQISVICPYKDHQQRSIIKNYEYMKEVLNYFQNHYKEKIQVDELAEIAHMSTTYFCKYFKKFTGDTPMDYLNKVRIENAAKLLKMTDQRIVDIAYEVGFQSLSYFTSMFKRYKNMTPSEYRKAIENEAPGTYITI